jgi:IS30 family transposase
LPTQLSGLNKGTSELADDLPHPWKASVKTPKRLTEDYRVFIEAMSNRGRLQCVIAKKIGFSNSTIGTEFKRNCRDDGACRSEVAHKLARNRKQSTNG